MQAKVHAGHLLNKQENSTGTSIRSGLCSIIRIYAVYGTAYIFPINCVKWNGDNLANWLASAMCPKFRPCRLKAYYLSNQVQTSSVTHLTCKNMSETLYWELQSSFLQHVYVYENNASAKLLTLKLSSKS